MMIKYRLGRRRAMNTFKRELIACGVPPNEAEELRRMYPFDLGDIIDLARGTPKTVPS